MYNNWLDGENWRLLGCLLNESSEYFSNNTLFYSTHVYLGRGHKTSRIMVWQRNHHDVQCRKCLWSSQQSTHLSSLWDRGQSTCFVIYLKRNSVDSVPATVQLQDREDTEILPLVWRHQVTACKAWYAHGVCPMGSSCPHSIFRFMCQDYFNGKLENAVPQRNINRLTLGLWL